MNLPNKLTIFKSDTYSVFLYFSLFHRFLTDTEII